MAKKNKKAKSELTYFLDHPDIKRHESPGNGSSATITPTQPAKPVQPAKPSIAAQINFGGKFKK